VEFLAGFRHALIAESSSSVSTGLTASRVEALTITMFEHGILEEEDVTLMQVGNMTFRYVAHQINELRRTKITPM